MYEKPNFEGHSIPLEEGELELSGLWGIEDVLERNEETESDKPVVIGSMRHVVQVGLKLVSFLVKANWILLSHLTNKLKLYHFFPHKASSKAVWFYLKNGWEKYLVFFGIFL